MALWIQAKGCPTEKKTLIGHCTNERNSDGAFMGFPPERPDLFSSINVSMDKWDARYILHILQGFLWVNGMPDIFFIGSKDFYR